MTRKPKAQARRKKRIRAVKRVAVMVLILSALFSATVLSSSAIRREILRITSNILETFYEGHPNDSPGSDEFYDYQTDIQIEQIEGIISDGLDKEGLPQELTFQIHVDGRLGVSITGLNEDEINTIKPYIEPMGAILSTAYSSERKNQIYYVQKIIRNYEEIKRQTDMENYAELMDEYGSIIREFLDNHDDMSLSDIISKSRTINYVNGKLIFDEE